MGLGTWFWSKVSGQDLAELQAQGDALDSQLATLNNQDYAPGGRIYNDIASSFDVKSEMDDSNKNSTNDEN